MEETNASTHPYNNLSHPSPEEVEKQRLLRKKKQRRNRILGGILVYFLLHLALAPVLYVFILKPKHPTLRLKSATFVGARDAANSSFSLTLNAALAVKNPNFGWYKYQNGSVWFSYGGKSVGNGSVPEGKVGFRSRKTVEGVVVELRLGSELRSRGNFTLNVGGKLEGRVRTLMMSKKKKSSKEMNCSLPIYMQEKAAGEIIC